MTHTTRSWCLVSADTFITIVDQQRQTRINQQQTEAVNYNNLCLHFLTQLNNKLKELSVSIVEWVYDRVN